MKKTIELHAAKGSEVALSVEHVRAGSPRFQFILWWDLRCWSRPRVDTFENSALGRLYGWSAQIGPFEVRKWK